MLDAGCSILDKEKRDPLKIQHPYLLRQTFYHGGAGNLLRQTLYHGGAGNLLRQTFYRGGAGRDQYPASRANYLELCNFLKT